MMPIRLRPTMLASMALLALATATAAAAQQVITLTPISNQRTVLASLRSGDTLRIAGSFANPLVLSNRDFGNVQVDASAATFQGGLVLSNVHNLAFSGGTFGRSDLDIRAWHTVRVQFSSNISLAQGLFLGNSDNRGSGLLVVQSNQVTVSDSQFTGHGTGLGVRSSSNVLVTRNAITGSFADGINVVDSRRVIVSSNSCSAFTPGAGSHPDCIQLWSLTGRPLQSDIAILNNSAIGNMQAFVSFDPRTGSGERLIFAGNYAAVTFTHGVSCTRCNDSIFIDNVLSNLPEARWGAPTVRLTEGLRNIVANNQSFDVRGLAGQPGFALAAPTYSSYTPLWSDGVGSQIGGLVSSGFFSPSVAISSVPEPASWLMLGVGFAAVGRQLRRRGGPRLVMA
jgi:nitrous oxidase accessory protein NosD